jgi:4-amino-4-deoxy-L-arabinose transferase-like glycosyltransferase
MNEIFPDGQPSKTTERLLVLILLAIFLIEGGIALVHMSATGDETHYLGMGRYLLKNQRWDLVDALLQPPLSYYLHSTILLALPLNDELFKIPDINTRGRALMATYPDDRVLLLARIPILLLGAGLGFLIFLWGKQGYGSNGGLLSLFLYTFHPVILGNSVQITPDLCLTFFTTLAAYLFWVHRDAPDWIHSLAVGGALGLALLSKYSAILLVIAFAALILLPPVLRQFGAAEVPHRWRLRHLALMLAAAVCIVNAGYLFRETLLPLQGNVFRSHLFQFMERTGCIRAIPIPIPLPYLRGMDLQHSVVESGFISYMLGEKALRGWFSYYIIAFLLKTPVPFILLLLLTAWKGRNRLHWIILIPAIIFPLYFSAIKLSRGVRYILPMYPLLCVWIGQLALWMKEWRIRPAIRWGSMTLLAWYAASTIYFSPYHVAYINEIGGGPGNGINLLFESDFDWGQELKGFSKYLKARNIRAFKFGCFSTADLEHYGIHSEDLPCENPARPQTGIVAASATAIQAWGCYDWLRDYKPVDKVGYTIFVYDIPPPGK